MKKIILNIMILWVSAHVSVIAATVDAGVFVPQSLNDREIVKVDENTYLGSKILPFKQKTYGQERRQGSTPSIGHDIAYFVFERLTDKNIKFWRDYNENQDENTRRMGVMSENGTRVFIVDGIASFRRSLDLYDESKRESYSIWIAYATRKDPRVMKRTSNTEYDYDANSDFALKNDDIEMTFSVFASNTSPITTHIGILRNFKYFESAQKPHLGLAMELHGFAGFAAKLAFPQITYMVTKPVQIMQKLMRATLEVGENLWIGSLREHEEYQKNVDGLNYLKPFIERFKDRKEILTLDVLDGSTLNKDQLENGFNEYQKKREEIKDYLKNNSVKDFFALVNSRIRLLKSPFTILPYSFISQIKNSAHDLRDSDTYEIATPEEREDLIKNKINTLFNEFFDNDIQNYFYNTIKQMTHFYTGILEQYEHNLFLKDDLSYMPPLDNRDRVNWMLKRDDGSWQAFTRPDWFGTINIDGFALGGHDDLRNHLPTVMIKIPALGNFWLRSVS